MDIWGSVRFDDMNLGGRLIVDGRRATRNRSKSGLTTHPRFWRATILSVSRNTTISATGFTELGDTHCLNMAILVPLCFFAILWSRIPATNLSVRGHTTPSRRLRASKLAIRRFAVKATCLLSILGNTLRLLSLNSFGRGKEGKSQKNGKQKAISKHVVRTSMTIFYS